MLVLLSADDIASFTLQQPRNRLIAQKRLDEGGFLENQIWVHVKLVHWRVGILGEFGVLGWQWVGSTSEKRGLVPVH